MLSHPAICRVKQNMPALTTTTIYSKGTSNLKIQKRKQIILMFCKVQMFGTNFAKTKLLAVVYQHYSEYIEGVNLIFTGK